MSGKRTLALGFLLAVCTMLGAALMGGANPLAAAAIPECNWGTCFGAQSCQYSPSPLNCITLGGNGEGASCTVTDCHP
jgi:hypothetical protein